MAKFSILLFLVTHLPLLAAEVRAYNCPPLVEYKFSQFVTDNYYNISGGVPMLRLTHAELGQDQIFCRYERTFARAEGGETPFGFVGHGDQSEDFYGRCRWTISLEVRDREKVTAGWHTPRVLKINKTHSSKFEWVVMDPRAEVPVKGCTYERRLQMNVDPSLFRQKEGVCVVNSTRTGFRCAKTLSDLTEIAPALTSI